MNPPSVKVIRTCYGLTNSKEHVEVVENGDGIFKLESPFVGADIKKPVLCGSDGCIYHHWNWSSNGIPTVLSGCNGNDPVCKVELYTPGWATVTVEFDDNNVSNEKVFVIWRHEGAPTTPKVSLAVSLTIPGSTGKIPIGGKGEAIAKVTPRGGSVKGLSVRFKANGRAVKITGTTSHRDPNTVRDGQSDGFAFAFKASRTGAATLVVDATAVTSDGKTVSGSGSTRVSVGGHALSIEIQVSPDPVKLGVSEKGEILPGEVKVKVILKNTSKDRIDNVQLLSLDPAPVVRSQQLDQLRFPRKALPARFAGSFAPGSEASKTFELKVTGDGKYEFRALALYNDPSQSGGNGRAFTTGGEFEAVVPYLYFTADIHRNQPGDDVTVHNGTDLVKGGNEWYVGGELKNLSSYQPICLTPLAALSDGNAISIGMQDVSKTAATVDKPPLAGLVKPGQSIPLGMLVQTSSTGATEGSVDVPIDGYLAEPGASCILKTDESMIGAGKALKSDQIYKTPGATSYVVHVDLTVEEAATQKAGLLNFFGSFAKSSFKLYGGIAHGLAAMAKWAHDNPRKAVDLWLPFLDPVGATDLASKATSSVAAAGDVLVNYFKTASPAETNSVFEFLSDTFINVSNDAYSLVQKEVVGWAKHWIDDWERAYANPKTTTQDLFAILADMAGEGAGQLQAIALQIFTDGLGKALAAEAPELEAAAKAATETPEVLATSKGGKVPVGRVLTLADQANAWGFPKSVVDKLAAISKKFNILIGARSRQAISTELEALGAVWKNSNFHQKTVSFIDRTYLRMGGIRQGLLGTRSFTAAGTSQAINEIRNSALSAAEKTEALARLAERINEGGADLDKLKRLASYKRKACSTCPETEGWVNAGFNANESGSVAANTSKTRWRRFKLVEKPILSEDGHTVLGTLYEPYEENLAYSAYPKLGKEVPELCTAKLVIGTVLCPITGDIDLVYIVNVNGKSLTADQMLKVLPALEEAGFAHTDLVTWVEQQTGSFYFPGKEKQLEGLALGKESTVQWAPDGRQRATYLGPLLESVAFGPNAYQLTIFGGLNAAFVP